MPIFRGGQALVDGGLVKNIPADVLVDHGCNYVIAVSVTAKIEQEFPPNRGSSEVNDGSGFDDTDYYAKSSGSE